MQNYIADAFRLKESQVFDAEAVSALASVADSVALWDFSALPEVDDPELG